MSFSIANNAGWYDAIPFSQPNDSTTPLSLSGIYFHAELRLSVEDASNKLDISSASNPPGFISDDAGGILYFSVDVSLTKRLTPGVYVMHITATDSVSGMVRSLCECGPCMVTVLMGVTR